MHPPSILVVDDNPEILLLIQLMLAGEDFAVRTVDSGKEALKALEDPAAGLPDALLTDIQMPEMDGLELIRRVRADPRTAGICILAVTANALQANVEEAYAAGCDGYITKPLDTRKFPLWVRQRLEAKRNGGIALPPEETASVEEPFPQARLLADCERQIERLLIVATDASRRDQARAILHQCAGTAGVLGYPQITALARELETRSAALNEREFIGGLSQLSDLLSQVDSQARGRVDGPI